MGNSKKEILALLSKQSSILNTIYRTEKFYNSIKPGDESALSQVQSRLNVIEPLHSEFIHCISSLERLGGSSDEALESGLDEVIEEFENRYFTLVGNLSRLLSNSKPSPVVSHIKSQSEMNIKLPPINMPTFKGDYTEWLKFKDSFLSFIHNNKNLEDYQRLHYLKTYLKSPALDLVSNMTTLNQNYKPAWDLLVKRYDNSRLITNAHANSLFAIQKMKSDSLQSIKDLTYEFFKHVKSLQALGEDINASMYLILPLLTSKFDVALLKRWEATISRDSKPTINDIELFLLKQIDILELSGCEEGKPQKQVPSSQHDKPKNKVPEKTNDKSKNYSKYAYATTQSPGKETESSVGAKQQPKDKKEQHIYPCYACKQIHKLYTCPTFISMTPTKRLELVTNQNICANCFNPRHSAENCKNPYKCRVCNLPHNTLVHQDSVVVGTATVTSNQHSILLATAIVNVITPQGVYPVRALLDGGSQSNLICESLVQRLQLTTSKCNVTLQGIGPTPYSVNKMVKSNISSRTSDFQQSLNFLVLPNFKNHLPQQPIDISKWKLPDGIQLADPEFNVSQKVEMLLGAECFYEALSEGQLRLNDDLPILQLTKFGWILSGKYPVSQNNVNTNFVSVTNFIETISCNSCSISPNSENDLNKLLPRFWELEHSHYEKPMSLEDQMVDEFFNKTVKRDSSGRYSVSLPFKENKSSLGLSSERALSCFYSLERRLAKNQSLYKQYRDFMSEYIKLGHMRELTHQEHQTILNENHYFLPHHAVIRESSATTKLRVVFNGSMPTTSGVSLNDVLHSGPPLQTDLFSVLIRFRSKKYGLISDVEKMFRQILVNPPDHLYQLVYWRDSPKEPIKIYCLLTVTYGTVPAPYLSIRTLHQLATDEADNFPLACKILKRDFFVDDLITSENSVYSLQNLYDQLTSLLSNAGMSLRKWCTNSLEFRQILNLKSHDDPNFIIDLSKDEGVKTLGVFWNPILDAFLYYIKFIEHDTITKRTIVSDVCKIFDPLGLLGPAIMSAKLFIRDLWLEKLGWDDVLSPYFKERWIEYVNQCSTLNDSSIPRYFTSISTPTIFELHGFCDASEQGYGACFYIKCINACNEVSVSLICSKSRVAPTKAQSIPRLELCGALLLSELYLKVRDALPDISFIDIYLWTDSVIVLHWLAAESCRWKTFVGNRVSKIQDNTPNCSWMHVSSGDNPADLLSRGSCFLPIQWWQGPSWLLTSSNYNHPELSNDFEIPDKKQETTELIHVTVNDLSPINELIKKSSSWSTLYRVVAYLLRFKSNCFLPKESRISGELLGEEIEKAQLSILKIIQIQMFPNEIKNLKENKNLPSTNRLLSLNPFLDNNGLLRVGGRIKNAPISFDQKHPVLLCSKHPTTSIIVRHYHKMTLHAGAQHVLYTIRQKFWPLNGKNLCKKIVRECSTCFRVNPKPLTYLMGDLPADRLKISKPFTFTGVDFAGPFMIKSSKRKNSPLVKAYACLFICMATKALHIEAVSDLTSEAFIACLRRFIARRGVCKTLFCDNGRNFVGADKQLRELYHTFNTKQNLNKIYSSFSDLNFEFIPARSPTFGGLWERAVRSCKHHLRRVMGISHLTFEELTTLLAQIEAQLNSRPLTPMSNDPSDLSVLSPSHFLVGEPLTAVPDVSNVENEPTKLLDRWQRVQQAQQQFWRRWSKEYLSQLQHRSKWRLPAKSTPKIGQLVVLMDENSSPLFWNLARITNLHPGKDGITRVVTVKTKHGESRRALNKVCPLPDNDEEGLSRTNTNNTEFDDTSPIATT